MLFSISIFAQSDTYTVEDLFKVKLVREAVISPDGKSIAYTVNIERPWDDGPGGDYTELHVLDIESGESRAYITGKNSLYSLSWTPNGKRIAFLSRMGDTKSTQVQAIRLDGGMPEIITSAKKGVSSYRWNPKGAIIAYVTVEKEKGRDPKLVKMGFNQELFEEQLSHRTLYMHEVASGTATKLTENISVHAMEWHPDGKKIAVQVTDKNLVDDSYMFKKIHMLDITSKEMTKLVDNPGKLGAMAFSPDGKNIAFVSAVDINDPVSGSLFVSGTGSMASFSSLKNYTKDFNGSVKSVIWKDNQTMLFVSDESVDVTLRAASLKDGNSEVLIPGIEGLDFNSVQMSGNLLSFTASHSKHPNEVFTYSFNKGVVKKHTNHNPWIEKKKMGKQERISYKARDGLLVEGVLIYPADYQSGQKYPLITYVHGGPEACVSNGWVTYYSMWGQMASGRGYFVFMPNYRASSGRGVAYSKMDQKDLGAAEFDDVLDGIKYLVDQGMVDESKVGIGGGSYGGYFSAWAATKHSDTFAASVVFVGISNQISKRNTTDIPYEDYYVHWNIWTYENYDLIYDRSPVKYVRNNKTPTLILHGKEDPRVHPSQSLELYRQLKLHGGAPTRLVWYPGEGHGNRKNPARMDYAYRTLAWFDYYLKGDGDKTKMPEGEIEYNLE